LWDKTRTWFFANDVPISLSSGSHYSTGVVKTNMAALYSIYVTSILEADADPQLESEGELACQNWHKGPPRWDIVRIRLNGNSVGH
jgi:hypothetical protein